MPSHYSKFSLNGHAQILVLKGPARTNKKKYILYVLIQVQVIVPVNFLCPINNISIYFIPPHRTIQFEIDSEVLLLIELVVDKS